MNITETLLIVALVPALIAWALVAKHVLTAKPRTNFKLY